MLRRSFILKRNRTYIGELEVNGKCIRNCCHYSLAVVDIEEKEFTYCDSLGWEIPEGLLEKVNSLLRMISKTEINVITSCYVNTSTSVGKHVCQTGCSKFFPLQTCGNVCGVAVIVVSVIAAYEYEEFKRL